MKYCNLMLRRVARIQTHWVSALILATLILATLILATLIPAARAEAATAPFSSQQVISSAADDARSVYAGDVDGDGDLDLMSASYDDDAIAWYENNGAADPSFTRNVISTAADGARSVHAADVDGDGDLDLMSASYGDNAIAWYENDGSANPSFTRIVITTEAEEASSVSAADLDGDGDLDLMSASFADDEIAWYENDGAANPGFTRIVITTLADGARSVHAADLDGDGDLDVMSAAAFGNEIAWYENDGAADPSFTRIVISTAATGAQSVYAGDVDGDGDLDLMSADANSSRIAWYENDGGVNPSFTRIVVSTATSGAISVFAGDVDGDGDLDLMSASRFDDEIAWYENDGGVDPSFTRRLLSSAADGAQSVFAGDVDGDGDLDLMSASQLDDKIAWYENETIHRSAVYPTRHLITSAADGAYSVHAADVDGDGDLDLMSASLNDDEIAWYENNGAAEPSFTRRLISTLAEGAVSVYAGDVDGDGDLDLMSASRWDNAIAWYENDGGANPTFTRHVISTAANGATSVYAGDVDGDGDLDLMSASALDDAIAWYENDGGANPTFTRRVISTAADFGESVYAGDVDGDGDLDLMSASKRDNAIAWYENDGGASPTFTRHVISIAADDAASVHAGDVDGDGDLDLMSASSEDDGIAWYENDGAADPTFTRHVISTAANHATSVYAADVDGDGDLDLMSASRDDNEIAWYENDGGADPTFTRHVISTAANGAVSVYAGDVDGDGDLDLMSASTFDHEIAWYENEGGQFALPTADVAPVRTTNNATVAALEVDAIHRGRAGDQDVELVTLELLLEDGTATALTNATADALLEALTIYLDDGSGLLEPGTDSVVATVTSSSLTAGVLTVIFADADPNVQIPFGSPKKYFVALTFEAGASSQTPDEIRVTHITESSSTGEDADHDLPLSLEFSSNRQSAVIEVNDAPVALGDAVMLFEDGGIVAGNVLDGTSGGLDSDEEGDSLSAVLVSGPSNGLLVGGLSSGGAFTYQPNPDFHGVDSFTYVATDGFENSNTATVTIAVGAVNDAPSFTVAATHGSFEDGGPQAVAGFATGISAGPANESAQALNFIVTSNSNPTLFLAAPALAANGTLTYTAEANANGTATVMVQLMDDGGTSNGGVDTSAAQSFDITVGAVNDAPSFTVPVSVTVDQDLGPQSFPGFATALSPGPIDEAAQSLTFHITGNTNPALFSAAPALSSDGTLTFTSEPLAVGLATLTVALMDDGGTANGGVDTSGTQEFEIEIADAISPEVVALDAAPGGALEDCFELAERTAALVVTFSEPMADPPGDVDPGDVTNPSNYQLIATGPDNDLATLGCSALLGDDVLVPPAGVTFDELTGQATVSFTPRLGDGFYRLLVCDSLEDPTGNALEEEAVVSFRQDAGNLFADGHFDCDLAGWELVSTTPEEIEYSVEDVDDALVSGSVQMTNLTGTSFGVGQCVNSTDASYTVGGSLRIDGGTTVLGGATVLVGVTTTCAFFAQADCLGEALGQTSSLELLPETAGLWLPWRLTVDAPAASAAALCSVSVDLLEGEIFDAFLDDLTLVGSLFRDGFESGDLSRWSSSSP